MKTSFPLVWDNTMRSAFVACPQKMWWEYGEHYKPKEISVHLHAGKAFAAGLEKTRKAYYIEEKSPMESQALGLGALIQEYGTYVPPKHQENKSLDRMIGAFAYYWTAFPLETDPVQPYSGRNGPMIEFSFALPLDAENLLHPETGEPIIYAGRADLIATYAGAISVYDDKTTSQLGPKWGAQWTRRSQFTGYAWAAEEYGIKAQQIVVRGIAILKNDYNHAQSITHRTPAHILEWRIQAIRDIQRAIQCWKDGYWDLSLADTCSSYGGCLFLQPCQAPNPAPWLEGNFSKRVWNPVAREEKIIPIIENSQ